MSLYTERSSRAYKNGKFAEELLQSLLPDFEFLNEDIDGMFLGVPLELKSCQMFVTRSDRANPRSGRYYLRGDQHNKLIETGGRYIFAVTEDGKFVRTRMILAARLMDSFEGAKTLSWPKLKGM